MSILRAALHDYAYLNTKVASLAPIWTQGAGGNISIKLNSEEMLIKPSGLRLDQAHSADAYLEIQYKNLAAWVLANGSFDGAEKQHSHIESEYAQAIKDSKSKGSRGLRASMEAGLHSLSPMKVTAHFHSLPAILMGYCSQQRPEDWKLWLAQQKSLPMDLAMNLPIDLQILPLVNPGLDLARLFIDCKSAVSILLNHGVILGFTELSFLERWFQFECQFLRDFGFQTLLTQLEALWAGEAQDFSPYLLGPCKFYFPDMAIYFPKIQKLLRPAVKQESPGNNSLNSFLINSRSSNPRNSNPRSRNQIDKQKIEPKAAPYFEILKTAPQDLREIWLATQILYNAAPELPELPEQMISEITQLPTEILRQKAFTGSES